MQALTTLTSDEKDFFESVKDFAKNEIGPKSLVMDQNNQLDESLIPKFFEMGLMGIEVPEKYQGSEASFFMAILAVQAMSQVDPAMGVVIDVQNTLVNNAIMRWGSEELKAKYLPQLVTERVGSYCLSENTSGSDAFALKTRAEKKGDRFILNGNKLWITNAKEAGVYIVIANSNPEAGYKGITAFIV